MESEGYSCCDLQSAPAYAIAVCSYVTATLATFFIDSPSERLHQRDDVELASAKSIQALQAEVSALRIEIQALAQRDLEQ